MEKTTIRDILSDEQRQEILITALEQHIKKCKGIANGKIVGERAGEREKRQAWGNIAEIAQDILDKIVLEIN